MQNKTKYILIAAVVVVVLFAAGMAYQQKTIMDLKSDLAGISGGSSGSGQKALNSPSTVRAVQSTLTSNTKEITGKITAKTDNSLTVEAEVADLSKLSGVPEEKLAGDTNALPKTKKTYKVSVNGQTQYPSMKFQDLSVGDQVIVRTNESVYQADSLTASEILVIGRGNISFAEMVKELKYIVGQVKEASDKYVVVETQQLDVSKIKISDPKEADLQNVPKMTKNYKVFIDSETSFLGSPDAIKVGDVIKAYSAKPVSSVTEFTAVKVENPFQPPVK
ncbi:MAG: hypothetical protein WC726_03540 [Parcubacteria group bacterium]|jgi:exosome complex RNA-binding protein Csl4